MEIRIQGVLYIDKNGVIPMQRCARCGGEIYGWGGCLRCEAMGDDAV